METNKLYFHEDMKIEESYKTKLKWKEPKKFKDEYLYSVVQIQESEGDLHFKFTRGIVCRGKTFYIVIHDYTKYTALDIINALDGIGFNTRHSYDAVLHFYIEKGLRIGSTMEILKDIL